MRWIPYGLILFGILHLLFAAEAAHNGVFEISSSEQIYPIKWDESPTLFQNRMRYTLFEGGCWIVAGCLILRFFRNVDRITPFSSGYVPGKAVDELEGELRRKDQSKED